MPSISSPFLESGEKEGFLLALLNNSLKQETSGHPCFHTSQAMAFQPTQTSIFLSRLQQIFIFAMKSIPLKINRWKLNHNLKIPNSRTLIMAFARYTPESVRARYRQTTCPAGDQLEELASQLRLGLGRLHLRPRHASGHLEDAGHDLAAHGKTPPEWKSDGLFWRCLICH